MHADNWSHPGHYLVDPYTWPFSPHGHSRGHEWPATPFVQCQSALPFWDTAISKFDHENPWLRTCMWSKVEVTFNLKNSKDKVMVKIKPDGHSSSIDMFTFHSMVVRLILVEIQQIQYFTLKIQGQGHGQGLTRWSHLRLRVQLICLFLFHGNQIIFGWDIANSIFDLENSRSRSRRKSNQVIYRSGRTIIPKIKEIQKVVKKLSHGEKSDRRRERRRRTNLFALGHALHVILTTAYDNTVRDFLQIIKLGCYNVTIWH